MKELSLEELKSVNGGHFTDDARKFISVNSDVIMAAMQSMEVMNFMLAANANSIMYNAGMVKSTLERMGVTGLVDVE